MQKNVSSPFGIPETAGVGFVLGVAGGALIGSSGGLVAFSALAGCLVLPVLRITSLSAIRLVRRLAPPKSARVSFVP